MFKEDAYIYVTDQNSQVDFKAIKAALFDCHCISGYFARTEETRWNEYMTTIVVPVYNDDWAGARRHFEERFCSEPALKGMEGCWVIVHNDILKWFRNNY